MYLSLLTSKAVSLLVSQKFASVQERATCLISGAFKTTAAEAFHLLPMTSGQKKSITNTNQPNPCYSNGNDLTKITRGTKARGDGRRRRHRYGRRGDALRSPEIPSLVDEKIQGREAATEQHNNIINTKENPPQAIYTDGSGQDGGIGIVAMMQIPGVQPSQREALSQMGTDNTATVYAAELQDIDMGFEAVRGVSLRGNQHN